MTVYTLQKQLGLPKYNSATAMFVCLKIPSINELLRKYVFISEVDYWHPTAFFY